MTPPSLGCTNRVTRNRTPPRRRPEGRRLGTSDSTRGSERRCSIAQRASPRPGGPAFDLRPPFTEPFANGRHIGQPVRSTRRTGPHLDRLPAERRDRVEPELVSEIVADEYRLATLERRFRKVVDDRG